MNLKTDFELSHAPTTYLATQRTTSTMGKHTKNQVLVLRDALFHLINHAFYKGLLFLQS